MVIQYVYYFPASYATEWLSRDTDRPRLVYQHSGISELGRDTCLLLLSGFDTDRAAQLLQFFERAAVVVGIQKGDLEYSRGIGESLGGVLEPKVGQ